jgi:hypothetical protein
MQCKMTLACRAGAEGEEMKFDVYRGKKNSRLRMATPPGAGLPSHVSPNDWVLMPEGSSQLHTEAARDIIERGFAFSSW